MRIAFSGFTLQLVAHPTQLANRRSPMTSGPFDLAGKVAIVTGGNGGIGLGMARGLAEAGADIAVVRRNESKSLSAVADLKARGGRAISIKADVTDKASGAATIDKTKRQFRRIDILGKHPGLK